MQEKNKDKIEARFAERKQKMNSVHEKTIREEVENKMLKC